MGRRADARYLSEVTALLRRLVAARRRPSFRSAPDGFDLLLDGPGASYVVEWKAAGDAANVGSAVRQLRQYLNAPRRGTKGVVPIVAVPYMGETGRRLSQEAGVSWIDLSGNAWIDAPGRHVRIEGRPNRFAVRGRPANVFAPTSSKVVRVLLMEPQRAFTQSELADASGVDKGRVSRLVRRLEAMSLVELHERRIRIVDPVLTVDAWREAYDFGRHHITKGIVGGRSADDVLRRVAKTLRQRRIRHAATGLAGAWLVRRFAMFRTVTFLVQQPVDAELLAELRFQEEPRGANVWLAVPRDDGPFMGQRTLDGISCAHSLQVYLDLKAQPERAGDAAANLRAHLFPAVRHG
jgi:MarR family/Transcriptional regulator, AbiEi antitoxin, Type IV TA system